MDDWVFSGTTPMVVVKKQLRVLYTAHNPALKRELMNRGYIYPNRRMRSLKHTKRFKNLIGQHYRMYRRVMTMEEIQVAIIEC